MENDLGRENNAERMRKQGFQLSAGGSTAFKAIHPILSSTVSDRDVGCEGIEGIAEVPAGHFDAAHQQDWEAGIYWGSDDDEGSTAAVDDPITTAEEELDDDDEH
eukprot:scaffold137058_cov31-Prasinocladus_malaysianus.AAC.1